MRSSTLLLASAGTLLATAVKAQTIPAIWADSVATKQTLSDTAQVSPFMPSGSTKHDEKVAAIKAYCDCEATPYAERKIRFEAISKSWPRTRKHYRTDLLQDYARDYIEGENNLEGEELPHPVAFTFSPLVMPLVHSQQLAEVNDETYTYSSRGAAICYQQVRLMYPAYASRMPKRLYPQIQAESQRQAELYNTNVRDELVEPWLENLEKQAIALTTKAATTKVSNRYITSVTSKEPSSLSKISIASQRSAGKYPIVITDIPYKEFYNADARKLTELIDGLNYHYRVQRTTFHSYHAYVDGTGQIMNVDSSKHASFFGYPGDGYFESLVKYRSQAETDSFKLGKSQNLDINYRIVYKTVGFPEGTYNGSTRLRYERVWLLTDKAGAVVSSYSNFSCVRPNERSSKSRIHYIGSGRYWVSQECEEGSISFLLNESGKILAHFSPRTRATVEPGEITLNSAPNPTSINNLGYYINGVLLLDNNTIIDLHGKVIYSNSKYKIKNYIDRSVALATIKMPLGQFVYAYVNYRTGKIIYTALDYERSSFSLPVIK